MRLSAEELAEVMGRGGRQKPSKFKNLKIGKYHSKKEARRAQRLKWEESEGLITDLIEQPSFELIPKQEGERAAKYTADFQYVRDGVVIVEDVKSAITRKQASYILRRKLMLKVHGVRILET